MASQQDPTNPTPEKVVAVKAANLSQGAEVLDSVRITGLSVSISLQGITIQGSVQIKLSGQWSSLSFRGTLASLDTWSLTLASQSMSIPA